MNKKAFIGLILSIFSVIKLLYSPYNISNKNFLVGFILALICVLGWSLESTICAYGMRDDKLSSTQALQIRQFVSAIFYGIIIIPIIGGVGLSKIIITSNLSILICFIALIGTASYMFYYKAAIDRVGLVKATGLNITYCIWSIIFDAVILGNCITLKLIL